MPFSLYITLQKGEDCALGNPVMGEDPNGDEDETGPAFMQTHLDPNQEEPKGSLAGDINKALPPKPKGAVASPKTDKSAKGGSDRNKFNQPTDYYSKERYPERPGNALGETDSSWVLPKGATPQTLNTKTKQEEVPNSGGATEATSNPTVSTTDPVDTVPSPVSSQAPQATQGLLGGGEKPNPKLTLKEPQQPGASTQQAGPQSSKDHQDLAAEAHKQGNPQLAAKHGKISNAKKVLEKEGSKKPPIVVESDGVEKDPSAAINAAIHKDKEAKAKSDLKEADKAAKEFKGSQEAKKKASNNKKKEDLKEAGKAAREFKDKQKAKASSTKQAHKDRLAKEKASKKAVKDKEKADIKEAGKAAKEFKQKQQEKLKVAKKQKLEDQKKLDKQRKSKDEGLAKEASREYKANQEEKARKKRVPANPTELASHATHTGSANEAKNKAAALVNEGAIDGQQKEVLAQVSLALDEISKQKHPPNAKEKKELNALVSHVNKMSDAHAKEKANKQKLVEAFKKDKAKAAKEKIKEEGKALKEQQKAEKEKAKQEAKEDKDGSSGASRAQPAKSTTAKKVGMNAFHSGRATGSALDRDATSDSAGGIGSKITSGLGTGAVSAGHKLLSGSNKKEDKEVSKGLFLDLLKANNTSPGQDVKDHDPIGLTGDSITEDDPKVGHRWPKDDDEKEPDEIEKALADVLSKVKEISQPTPTIFELSHLEKISLSKSITVDLKASLENLVKGL